MATRKQAQADTAGEIACTLEGNRLRLIESGPDLRAALLDLIGRARHSLKLYYYIFTDDDSGAMVRDALITARGRGVTVTLMVDAFGSGSTSQAFFDPLVEAGGHFAWFGAKRSTRYLIRNHQKMAIADDMHLLIGGFNIGDDYFCTGPECWADLGLMIDGPETEAMVRWYGQLWRWAASRKQSFRTLRKLVRHWDAAAHHDGPSAFRWLIGGPTRRLSPWAQVVKRDLERGRKLDMIAAYFSPGRGMLKRIARTARRQGARLIFAARSDNGATIAATRLIYGWLLKRGVEIYEYQPYKMHMKLIVIDDAVYVGSANFDMRSLFLNLELMLRIEDKGFAQAVQGMVDRQIEQSRPITWASHRASRGVLTALKGWISYLLVGVLDYTVTRRLNFRDPNAD